MFAFRTFLSPRALRRSPLAAAATALLAALAALLLSSQPAQAAALSYSETWTGDGLEGWQENTLGTTVINPGGDGNTGGANDGYLLSRRGGPFEIGALSLLPAVTGDYSGHTWSVSVDVRREAGDVSDVWLRFRYQDATFNGWRYRLSGDPGPDWQTFAVAFDPSWSDLQAQAAGWETDLLGGFASVSWAQTMSNVFYPEVRIDGPTTSLAAGIDNFRLQANAVPEPWSAALLLAGLAAAAATRRSVRRQPTKRAAAPLQHA